MTTPIPGTHPACFRTLSQPNSIPEIFPSPYREVSHSLVIQAADALKISLEKEGIISALNKTDEGKMFGVLLVESSLHEIGFFAAFSGMLNGQWHQNGFVPPVFNVDERNEFLLEGEEILQDLSIKIIELQNDTKYQKSIQQLKNIHLDYKEQQRCLKKQLKKNKNNRQSIREHAQQTGDQPLLSELSFESQRDKRLKKELLTNWQKKVSKTELALEETESMIDDLRQQRLKLSQKLQKRVFKGYVFNNIKGEEARLSTLFENKQPPGGAGDCAAPKLFTYAYANKLRPIAMAEFWIGAEPKAGVRHHGYYYPPCRGKCRPILSFMMQGLDVEKEPSTLTDDIEPEIVLEDEFILVLNKPSGFLSVPGKVVNDSVISWLKMRYPTASGPLLVHRLDMSTSGLLLAAKTAEAHKKLQAQFIFRSVKKRYVALLSQRQKYKSGIIQLPLRVDLDDRPRQMVCYKYGKSATTRWELIENTDNGARVFFYPITGRTHQLRIHAAHKLGLQAPIIGDELYGKVDKRLMLHAERLIFRHPASEEEVVVKVPVPF